MTHDPGELTTLSVVVTREAHKALEEQALIAGLTTGDYARQALETAAEDETPDCQRTLAVSVSGILDDLARGGRSVGQSPAMYASNLLRYTLGAPSGLDTGKHGLRIALDQPGHRGADLFSRLTSADTVRIRDEASRWCQTPAEWLAQVVRDTLEDRPTGWLQVDAETHAWLIESARNDVQWDVLGRRLLRKVLNSSKGEDDGTPPGFVLGFTPPLQEALNKRVDEDGRSHFAVVEAAVLHALDHPDEVPLDTLDRWSFTLDGETSHMIKDAAGDVHMRPHEWARHVLRGAVGAHQNSRRDKRSPDDGYYMLAVFVDQSLSDKVHEQANRVGASTPAYLEELLRDDAATGQRLKGLASDEPETDAEAPLVPDRFVFVGDGADQLLEATRDALNDWNDAVHRGTYPDADGVFVVTVLAPDNAHEVRRFAAIDGTLDEPLASWLRGLLVGLANHDIKLSGTSDVGVNAIIGRALDDLFQSYAAEPSDELAGVLHKMLALDTAVRNGRLPQGSEESMI